MWLSRPMGVRPVRRIMVSGSENSSPLGSESEVHRRPAEPRDQSHCGGVVGRAAYCHPEARRARDTAEHAYAAGQSGPRLPALTRIDGLKNKCLVTECARRLARCAPPDSKAGACRLTRQSIENLASAVLLRARPVSPRSVVTAATAAFPSLPESWPPTARHLWLEVHTTTLSGDASALVSRAPDVRCGAWPLATAEVNLETRTINAGSNPCPYAAQPYGTMRRLAYRASLDRTATRAG